MAARKCLFGIPSSREGSAASDYIGAQFINTVGGGRCGAAWRALLRAAQALSCLQNSGRVLLPVLLLLLLLLLYTIIILVFVFFYFSFCGLQRRRRLRRLDSCCCSALMSATVHLVPFSIIFLTRTSRLVVFVHRTAMKLMFSFTSLQLFNSLMAKRGMSSAFATEFLFHSLFDTAVESFWSQFTHRRVSCQRQCLVTFLFLIFSFTYFWPLRARLLHLSTQDPGDLLAWISSVQLVIPPRKSAGPHTCDVILAIPVRRVRNVAWAQSSLVVIDVVGIVVCTQEKKRLLALSGVQHSWRRSIWKKSEVVFFFFSLRNVFKGKRNKVHWEGWKKFFHLAPSCRVDPIRQAIQFRDGSTLQCKQTDREEQKRGWKQIES